MTIGDQGGGGVQHGACHGCNKEVTKVVDEVNKELVKEVNEGLLLVCRCGDVVLSTSFLMSEQFEGPYGNYKLEKGILHVNYVLKRFPVETT